MKCLKCNTDSKRSERADGKCPKCGHIFVFEPQNDKITDLAFRAVLDDVSARDTLQYTQGQLYFAFNRRLGKKFSPDVLSGVLSFFSIVAIIGGIIGASTGSFWMMCLFILGLAMILFVAIRGRRPLKEVAVDRQTFHALFQRWVAVNKNPKGLINEDKARVKSLNEQQRKELSKYSFDRLLIVERDLIAVMLIRNNFHFENNCAILSLDGYPGNETREMVLSMANQNPALKVFLAHDASADGCAALARLRAKGWLADDKVAVSDLGLRPSQVMAMKRALITRDAAIPTGAQAEALAWLDAKERAWLNKGNAMSIDTLSPASLMRALHQGFARTQMLTQAAGADGADGALILIDPISSSPAIWSGSSSYDQFASDSFG
jgi:hypothetical protein